MKNARPLDELELYELIVAAYPEKFGKSEETDDLWNEVMDFANELTSGMDVDELCDLLGRVVMLAMPMQSALTKSFRHALGQISIKDGQATMMAVVTRPASINDEHV